jgi:hypothetical protein
MPDYVEIDSDLLILAAESSDYNRREIAERISDMTPAERRVLRQALTTLDELLDADCFERHMKK